MGIALNVGVTPDELRGVLAIIEKNIGRSEADNGKQVLNELLQMCIRDRTYGRRSYDFQENTLVFIAPGQVFGHEADGSTFTGSGWCLLFHQMCIRDRCRIQNNHRNKRDTI